MTVPASSAAGPDQPLPGANAALVLLLSINLFNYIDRQVLSAVLPLIQRDRTMFDPNDPLIQSKSGLLTSAFLLAYMLVSPVVGWLDGHGYRRWVVLGLGVTAWSVASGTSGFATGVGFVAAYYVLLMTRCLVGVGEGAYGPVASAMLADVYPARHRGLVMALFNMAIPVGSALGFIIGGQVAEHFGGWRHAFWVTYAGLILGALCFTRREFRRPPRAAAGAGPSYPDTLRMLARNRSFVLCCAGMTAVTFVIGGLAAWVPVYVLHRESRYVLTPAAVEALRAPPGVAEADRLPADALPADALDRLAPKADGAERDLKAFDAHLAGALTPGEEVLHLDAVRDAATKPGGQKNSDVTTIFGLIIVAGGLVATAVGAWGGERLRKRGVRGAYFWVIGLGALFALPAYLGMLFLPFPLAWLFAFLAVFGLFLHVGPGFTIIANVVPSEFRATAFAVNILVIHALGDVISPPLIGIVADLVSLPFAFLLLSGVIVLGGFLWLLGVRGLEADTQRAEAGG